MKQKTFTRNLVSFVTLLGLLAQSTWAMPVDEEKEGEPIASQDCVPGKPIEIYVQHWRPLQTFTFIWNENNDEILKRIQEALKIEAPISLVFGSRTKENDLDFPTLFSVISESTNVISLKFNGCIDDEEWKIFTQFLPKLKPLKSLSLRGPKIFLNLEQFTQFAQVLPRMLNLRILELKEASLYDNWAKPLASALKKCPHLKFLYLPESWIETPAAITLLESAKFLEFLDLSDNKITMDIFLKEARTELMKDAEFSSARAALEKEIKMSLSEKFIEKMDVVLDPMINQATKGTTMYVLLQEVMKNEKLSSARAALAKKIKHATSEKVATFAQRLNDAFEPTIAQRRACGKKLKVDLSSKVLVQEFIEALMDQLSSGKFKSLEYLEILYRNQIKGYETRAIIFNEKWIDKVADWGYKEKIMSEAFN